MKNDSLPPTVQNKISLEDGKEAVKSGEEIFRYLNTAETETSIIPEGNKSLSEVTEIAASVVKNVLDSAVLNHSKSIEEVRRVLTSEPKIEDVVSALSEGMKCDFNASAEAFITIAINILEHGDFPDDEINEKGGEIKKAIVGVEDDALKTFADIAIKFLNLGVPSKKLDVEGEKAIKKLIEHFDFINQLSLDRESFGKEGEGSDQEKSALGLAEAFRSLTCDQELGEEYQAVVWGALNDLSSRLSSGSDKALEVSDDGYQTSAVPDEDEDDLDSKNLEDANQKVNSTPNSNLVDSLKNQELSDTKAENKGVKLEETKTKEEKKPEEKKPEEKKAEEKKPEEKKAEEKKAEEKKPEEKKPEEKKPEEKKPEEKKAEEKKPKKTWRQNASEAGTYLKDEVVKNKIPRAAGALIVGDAIAGGALSSVGSTSLWFGASIPGFALLPAAAAGPVGLLAVWLIWNLTKSDDKDKAKKPDVVVPNTELEDYKKRQQEIRNKVEEKRNFANSPLPETNVGQASSKISSEVEEELEKEKKRLETNRQVVRGVNPLDNTQILPLDPNLSKSQASSLNTNPPTPLIPELNSNVKDVVDGLKSVGSAFNPKNNSGAEKKIPNTNSNKGGFGR